MCCLFGILDYQGRLSLPRRRQMLAVLARECEARGTDAAGIAYCVNRHMTIYKAPMPAHLVNFQPRPRLILSWVTPAWLLKGTNTATTTTTRLRAEPEARPLRWPTTALSTTTSF